MTTNNRPTFKQLYDEIIPMKENIIQVKTLLETHIKNYDKQMDKNNVEHKAFWKTFVSSKAFFGWLGALSTIITIVTVLLFMR